jgi:hypothetical protein
MKNVMNCNVCGRFVSPNKGECQYERSDLDGLVCVIAITCYKCLSKLKPLKQSEVSLKDRREQQRF